MLLDPKKNFASVIVGKMKADGGSEMGAPEGPAEDDSMGKKAAASKLMSAIKADDEAGVAAALSDFIDMHEPDSDEAPEAEGA